MNEQSFTKQINGIFRRSPLVPVVIDVTDGRRIVVDMPEQLEVGHNSVTIRKRTDPILHRVDYEDIKQVTPLDELPGENGGLSYGEFYGTVRPLLWREPFQPFVLEFRDGSRLVIDRPGRLSLGGRFGVFMPPGPVPLVRFTYDQVVRVSSADMARAG
jgi:hypothetical protein